MATTSENTVTIPQPVAKVHEALTNADYWAYNAANLSPTPGEVHEFQTTNGGAGAGGSAVATLYEVLPMDVLPEAARAMISEELKVKRVVTVGPLEGSTATITYTADVKGAPVDLAGNIALAGDDASTTLTYNNDISVKIPFMGPSLAPKVGDALSEIFDNEGELTSTWIDSHLK